MHATAFRRRVHSVLWISTCSGAAIPSRIRLPRISKIVTRILSAIIISCCNLRVSMVLWTSFQIIVFDRRDVFCALQAGRWHSERPMGRKPQDRFANVASIATKNGDQITIASSLSRAQAVSRSLKQAVSARERVRRAKCCLSQAASESLVGRGRMSSGLWRSQDSSTVFRALARSLNSRDSGVTR